MVLHFCIKTKNVNFNFSIRSRTNYVSTTHTEQLRVTSLDGKVISSKANGAKRVKMNLNIIESSVILDSRVYKPAPSTAKNHF